VAEKPAQERTEKATPRRRQEARKEGKVARSQELSSIAILMFGLGSMYFIFPSTVGHLRELATWVFANAAAHNLTATNLGLYVKHVMTTFAIAVGPILLILSVIGLAANLLQVGVLFTPKPLEPKLDKLNVVRGLARLFSVRSLFELCKDVVKLSLIGIVGYFAVKSEMQHVQLLPDMSVAQITGFLGAGAFRVALKCSLMLAVLAIFDYAFQRWEYEKSIRMTKQEVKEEMKNTEGNPQIKTRIRQVQRDVAFRRMMSDVPKADVVVTNPTHIAVALKYDLDKMDAPRVVAKGQRLIAERIKEIAEESGVPVVENRPLAQALYKACEVGMQIPASLFRAVAEVLAYVYRLKGAH
jgi:flagellar biosynthetic protein FlhB